MIVSAGKPTPSFGTEVRSFRAADGLVLRYRIRQANPARARVRVVHGLGEHGGRYEQLADTLAARGVSVVVPDLRGHGVSEGRRGHIRRFEDYLRDFEELHSQVPGAGPEILIGHSLGGLIALRAVQTGRAGDPVGLVLSAPALGLPPTRPASLDALASVLSWIAPALPLPNGIDPADLSHDVEEVAAYRADPLVHDRITPRLYSEMRAAMRAAARDAPAVQIPVLLYLPLQDRVVSSAATREVALGFRGPVRIVECPESFHEPLHELRREDAIGEIARWIEEQLA